MENLNKISSILLLCLHLSAFITTEGKQQCFKDGQLADMIQVESQKFVDKVVKRCKEEKISASLIELDLCVLEKISAAEKECSQKNSRKENWKKFYVCQQEKSGAGTPTEEEMSFEYFRNNFLEIAHGDAQEMVADVLDSCKSDLEFSICGYKKLAEVCQDMETYYELLKELLNTQQ